MTPSRTPSSRRAFHQSALAAASALLLAGFAAPSFAASADDLNASAAQALAALYKSEPVAEVIGKKAKAILVFPNITKAGLIFGGSYGEGVLMEGGKVNGYYNSVSASWGWQAGAESYSYVLFLMNAKAVNYLTKTQGWEFGVGPSVVVVNQGIAKNLSTTTLKDNAYAFVSDQQGLMASLSFEGTKISHIKR
jgi:lipid-binding SYLF domain-containing protein